MKSFAVKNIVSLLSNSVSNSSIELTFKEVDEKLDYKFYIENSTILLKIIDTESSTKQNREVSLKMYNSVFDIFLPDGNFKPTSMINSRYYSVDTLMDKTEVNMYYEANLLVHLFTILRDKVCFILKSNDSIVHCNYINGKVMYREETDSSINITITDLYKINDNFYDYTIMLVSCSIKQQSYKEYLSSVEREGRMKNKQVKKIIGGVRC